MGIILLIFILYLLWRVAVKNISRKLPTLKDKVMNFKKVALASVMGVSMLSGVANAAVTADQGHGTVTFTGSILNAPCSIAPGQDGEALTVDFGGIAQGVLEANSKSGTSDPRPFTILLTNCDTLTLKTVTTTFTGSAGVVDGSLGLTGTAKGASIILTDGSSTQIKLGTATAPQTLQNGDNHLNFSAYLQGNGASATITPGEFTSIADFSLAYQ